MGKSARKPRTKKSKGLLARQRLFVEYYLICWNAAQAARQAGYKSKSNVQGARMLANVSIRALVDQRLAQLAMSSHEVLARLTDHACVDMSDFVNPANGEIDLAKAEKSGKLHLIKAYSRTDRGDRIELVGAQTALEMLGRYHKLFTEKVEHSGKVDGPPPVVVYIPTNGRDNNPAPGGPTGSVPL